MYKKEVHIPKYDWKACLYFHVAPRDEDEIHEALEKIGAPSWVHARMRLDTDTGFTYSNRKRGKSVVVICQASCPCEWRDTISHEKFHLTMHIISERGIDPMSEEAAYLAGDLEKEIACECQGCN